MTYPCRFLRARGAELPRSRRSSSGLTSVTVVLWKVSVLYSQPPRQVPGGRPSAGPPGPLRFPGPEQASSGWTLRELKFTEPGGPSEDQEERQRWGGTAPVNTDTSMWNARKI